MKEEEYGACNVIVALGSQKLPAKRRLSSSQTKSPLNTKVAKRNRFNSSSTATSSSLLEEEEEEEQQQQQKEKTRWACHTIVLHRESAYFAALFGENFIESKANIVYLPTSIVTGTAMENIINYMYTHQIHKATETQDLCDIYLAADYLLMDKLCELIVKILFNDTVHKCICYCHSCILNVPELFLFCHKKEQQDQEERIGLITQKLICILTNDPEKTLSTYWTSRHLAKLLIQLPQDSSQALSQKILYRVNKSNAIESLYACFTASNILSTNDPLLSWSKPLHSTLTSVQLRSTLIISKYFDFFCCQYPALLSCIDGITYSFDFLEYLLLHILEDQMDCSNVGVLYKGIVIDLMSRHAVQYNDQVKNILIVAKVMILCYITRRIDDVKRQGGLDVLNKNTLKILADDLDVKPKSLLSSNHPLFISRHSIFSFLIPSIPNLTTLSTSTTQHTNGLSRHSSRSTYTSPPPPTNYSLFVKRLSRLFKKFGPPHQGTHFSPARPPPPQRLSTRYASASTVHTTNSTWSASWLQQNSSGLSTTRKSTFSKIKRRKSFATTSQVSAPMVGMNRRVQLSRRPTLTVGTVLFIGHVNFADGIWIGVELDRRVGKNDGSVDGYRYFTSSPHRGVFVRPEDVSIVV